MKKEEFDKCSKRIAILLSVVTFFLVAYSSLIIWFWSSYPLYNDIFVHIFMFISMSSLVFGWISFFILWQYRGYI